MLVLAPDTVAGLSVQRGNNLLPMIVVWCFGSVIIHSLGRFHITATYVLSFLGFAVVRSLVTGHPLVSEAALITGPMYQLFIFFMITDPKTMVRTFRGQCVVAFLVAAVEASFRLLQVGARAVLRAVRGRTDCQPRGDRCRPPPARCGALRIPLGSPWLPARAGRLWLPGRFATPHASFRLKPEATLV